MGGNMKEKIWFLVLSAALTMGSVAPGAAEKKYDPGVTDTEIKIGQTVAFSGPASAYSALGKTAAAYMKMINDHGGINGRKINLIQYDDAYSPPKTVEQTRRLVESDEVLLIFQPIGTGPSAAVQKYLNQKKVPQLFPGSGGSRFTDPKNFPYSAGFNPNYKSEGRIYAQYVLENYPNARIGVLYQGDDFGKDYLAGFTSGLGAKASIMIVAEASYELSDPTIESQIVQFKSRGVDLIFDAATAKFTAQAIRKIAALGWQPVHILNINVASVGAVIQPAGLENSKGVISAHYIKDTLDPTWKDDPGLKKYLEFMARYYPEGDKDSSYNTSSYSKSQLMVEILKRCGDNLTRENIMKQVANLHDIQLDLLLPGILGNTSPTDYRVIKQFQMMKFNGERWELFGSIVTDRDNP